MIVERGLTSCIHFGAKAMQEHIEFMVDNNPDQKFILRIYEDMMEAITWYLKVNTEGSKKLVKILEETERTLIESGIVIAPEEPNELDDLGNSEE